MTYLLSEEGRRALRALAEKPILYAFDFDGTLAPISSDRDAVQIPPSINEWIKELAKRAPCAVVSGQALADLAPQVQPDRLIHSWFTREKLLRLHVQLCVGVLVEILADPPIRQIVAQPCDDIFRRIFRFRPV
ncbi:MAG: hypothetical protein CAF43_004115 [Nitrospira sp. CG24C]|nr:MAG: hypothetical protein CAF43_004115 [Nitrospira sp. CG24C]